MNGLIDGCVRRKAKVSHTSASFLKSNGGNHHKLAQLQENELIQASICAAKLNVRWESRREGVSRLRDMERRTVKKKHFYSMCSHDDPKMYTNRILHKNDIANMKKWGLLTSLVSFIMNTTAAQIITETIRASSS